jgi:hypothetical protein
MATVLSMMSGTPASWATAATPSMSRTSLRRVADATRRRTALVFGRTAAPGVEVVGVVHEGHLDAELGQRVVEQVVGAAVEVTARHDVVAGLGQVEDA